MTRNILRIDASASTDTSVTRKLADQIIARLNPGNVTHRDLAAQPLPQIDAAWVAARALPADQRGPDDRARLALSDMLIDEIRAADMLVIGVPMYNFSIPASLKAWIDLIARAGVTFRYTADGPVGLLTGKRAVLAVASGGVSVGSQGDFATPYLIHVLNFVGISDIQVVAADRMAVDADLSLGHAHLQIDALAA